MSPSPPPKSQVGSSVRLTFRYRVTSLQNREHRYYLNEKQVNHLPTPALRYPQILTEQSQKVNDGNDSNLPRRCANNPRDEATIEVWGPEASRAEGSGCRARPRGTLTETRPAPPTPGPDG